MPDPTPEEIEAQRRLADEAKADAKEAEDAKLGEGGEKALKAERAARAKAEKEAKAAREELEALRLESASEQEKALAAAKAEGKNEATTEANKRIVRAEVRPAAAGKLSDAADAVAFIDLEQFEVQEDGTVDETAIAAAIATLIEQKPYLAAGEQKPPPAGNPDGGARPPVTTKTLDEAIREAETKGDWSESMRLKAVKATNKS